MSNEVHIGSIIKQKLMESPMTVAEFADRINLHRASVYHIFKKSSIDTERLKKISNVLGYDFINDIIPREDKLASPKQTILIAVEVDVESIRQLNLPEDFIRLIKILK